MTEDYTVKGPHKNRKYIHRYRILALNKKCIVCEKEILYSTETSKKKRESKKYCSNKCRKIGQKILSFKFHFL